MSQLLYGLDKELAQKQANKYTPERAAEVCKWIEQVLGKSVFTGGQGQDGFMNTLKDGVVLLELMEKLTGQPVKIQRTPMPFKQMENINMYLTLASQLGVPQSELFHLPSSARS